MDFKLEIGNKTSKDNPTNSYIVKTYFRHGNSNSLTTRNLYAKSNNEDEMKKLYAFIDMLRYIKKNNIYTTNQYHIISEYALKIILPYRDREMTLFDYINSSWFWHSDNEFHDKMAIIHDWEVRYFDSLGTEYEVSVLEVSGDKDENKRN